ncbi:MAG TPA: hypothetical protein VGJ31_17930 [Dongiaceae bacterium]
MPEPSPLNDAKLEEIIESTPTASPVDEQVAALESKAEAARDRLLEERFIWIIISIILFNSLVFIHMDNWAGPLVIGLFQLIAIVIFAERCGVNEVAPLIDRILGSATEKTRRKTDNSDV